MLNRKIAISLITIVAALALTAGGTFALFNSTATNAGNTFGTGALTLSINTVAGTSTGVFSVASAIPGQTFNQALTLKNEGNVPASSVKVSGITLGGNSEIADKLMLQLYLDTNANNVYDSGADTSLGTGALNDPSWTGFVLPGVTLAGGASSPVRAQLTFDSTADNTYQGKSVTFDLGFMATQ